MKNRFHKINEQTPGILNISIDMVSVQRLDDSLCYGPVLDANIGGTCHYCGIDVRWVSDVAYMIVDSESLLNMDPPYSYDSIQDNDEIDADDEANNEKGYASIFEAERICCCALCYSQSRLNRSLHGLGLCHLSGHNQFKRQDIFSYYFAKKFDADTVVHEMSACTRRIGTSDPNQLYTYLSNTDEYKTIQRLNRRWLDCRSFLFKNTINLKFGLLNQERKSVSLLNKGVYSGDKKYFSEEELNTIKLKKDRFYHSVNRQDQLFVKRQLYKAAAEDIFNEVSAISFSINKRKRSKSDIKKMAHGVMFEEAVRHRNISEQHLLKIYQSTLSDKINKIENTISDSIKSLANNGFTSVDSATGLRDIKAFLCSSVEAVLEVKNYTENISEYLIQIQESLHDNDIVETLRDRSEKLVSKISLVEVPLKKQLSKLDALHDSCATNSTQFDRLSKELVTAQTELSILNHEIDSNAKKYAFLSNIVFNVNRLVHLLSNEMNEQFISDINKLCDDMHSDLDMSLIARVKNIVSTVLADTYTHADLEDVLLALAQLQNFFSNGDFTIEDSEIIEQFASTYLSSLSDFRDQIMIKKDYKPAVVRLLARVEQCINSIDDVDVVSVLDQIRLLLIQLRDDEYEREYKWLIPEYFEEFFLRKKLKVLTDIYQDKINHLLTDIYLLPVENTSELLKFKEKVFADFIEAD